MANSTSERMNRGISPHAMVAVIACIVSIVIHIALLLTISDVRFDMGYGVDQKLEAKDDNTLSLFKVNDRVPNNRIKKLLDDVGGKGRESSSEVQVSELSVAADSSKLEPDAITDEGLAGANANIVKPVATPKRSKWVPREEILSIDKKISAVGHDRFKRRVIPKVERVRNASDIILSVDVDSVGSSKSSYGQGSIPSASIKHKPQLKGPLNGKPSLTLGEKEAKPGTGHFAEKPSDVTAYKPIEKLLVANVETYNSFMDFKYGYFKIEVSRISENALPVIPKDIIFVQDSSASMSEQRLYFCRQALTNSLSMLGAEDRFNIVSFKDNANMCFPTWSSVTPENIKRADSFISNLKAGGNTDIFSSMKLLLTQKRVPGRPMVAILVTDGRSNTGMVRSSDIIGEFSKLNNGAISVFTMGTVQTANSYLLDFLSYANRGSSQIAKGGRWGIPDTLATITKELRRIVLADVSFRFSAGTDVEVYPIQTSNLYMDRPIVLYGRYPKGMQRMVFQATGKAGKTDCDMIFDIPLGKSTPTGSKDIRKQWASKKIYYLISEQARNPSATVMQEITETARKYNVDVPYERNIGR